MERGKEKGDIVKIEGVILSRSFNLLQKKYMGRLL